MTSQKPHIRFIFCLLLAVGGLHLTSTILYSQDVCPAGKVCVDQATANKLFDAVNQLISAKDVINKMLQERNSSDATIAAANKVIDAMNQREEINGQIILKLKDLNAVYEKVIALQQTIIEKLTTQLNKPKSAFSKFMTALKEIGYLAAGVLIGSHL
jgi:hypothetical protein